MTAKKKKRPKTPPELRARWRENQERMERILDRIRVEEATKAEGTAGRAS